MRCFARVFFPDACHVPASAIICGRQKKQRRRRRRRLRQQRRCILLSRFALMHQRVGSFWRAALSRVMHWSYHCNAEGKAKAALYTCTHTQNSIRQHINIHHVLVFVVTAPENALELHSSLMKSSKLIILDMEHTHKTLSSSSSCRCGRMDVTGQQSKENEKLS